MGKNSRNVIIDNGAGRVKYEVIGEQGQMKSMPNCVARMNKQMQVLVGDEVDGVANGGLLSYTRPFERGYLTNVHCQLEVWSRLFNDVLKLGDVNDTNLILTEAPFVPESIQNDINEVIFEDFGFDGCIRRPAASFSAYEFCSSSSSRGPATSANVGNTHSCTIIDSGFSFTHVLPFVNGKCCKRGVRRVNIGGKLLTNYLKETVSYRQWNMMDEYKLMDQVKETLCYVSDDFHRDLNAVHLSHQKPQKGGFVLPDFQSIMQGYVRQDHQPSESTHQELLMEIERFAVPEVLFYPSDVGMEQGGIAEATGESIGSLDPVDAGLAVANLVLTGGNCKFPQFRTRFHKDVRSLIPDMFPIQTYLPPDPQSYALKGAVRWVRDSQAASALAPALGSRKEYLERGSAHINEKYWKSW
eukprot:GSChrysophyteH1.ASY1.ANO1.2257.1 assembled CDS